MTSEADLRGGDHAPSVVTVGTYDGVHLGHRRLIAETISAAEGFSCKSVVVTFSRHPSAVLRPDAPVLLLTSLAQKISLLRDTGIDEIVVIDFDKARATERAEDFIRDDLVGQLHAREVVVGADFRFGFERRGDVKMLTVLGEQYGFVTKGIQLVLDDATHSVVSSTRIRHFIGAGEMTEAARLLGRPHEVIGNLIEQEGAPEVVIPSSMMLPPPGLYRVELRIHPSPDDITTENEVISTYATVGARGEQGVPVTVPIDVVGKLNIANGGLSLAFCSDRELSQPEFR